MSESRLNAWKYQHAGAASRSRRHRWLAGGLLVGSLLALKWPPLALFLFVASVIVFLLSATKKILVGGRYLICGSEIVYFANVARVERNDVAGTLALHSPNGRSLLIERDKFPSNARKADKIRKNKAAKFAKVAERIITHVQAANPAADIEVHC